MTRSGAQDRPRVLLVGAGHTHALVLEQWAEEPPEEAELVVVTDRPRVVYSGMIPGIVAGEYTLDEGLIDAEALARRAAARFMVGRVVDVDADRRRVRLADGTTLPYDLASLDVGSTVKGPDGSTGPPEGTVSAREVGALQTRLRMLEARHRDPSVVVVGAGAAGVEVAAAVQARFRRLSSPSGERGAITPTAAVAGTVETSGSALTSGPAHPPVTVVEGAAWIMDSYPERVARRVRRALEVRGIQVRTGATVEAVEEARSEESERRFGEPAVRETEGDETGAATERDGPVAVVLSTGERLLSDLTVWATGAAPPPLAGDSGIPTDGEGFILVNRELRVRGHSTLFAVGDCASVVGRTLAKAGVHAVRQAPVLFENLRILVREPSATDLRRYEPQTGFLTLLNLGDGTALGTKWGLTAEGRWVRWVKDVIDRRFVARFRS